MPLESLSQSFSPDEPGRKLREVQIEHEQEKKNPAREAVIRKFDALKTTDFFNAKKDLWRESAEQWSVGLPETQLLGVALEAYKDPTVADEKLKKLRESYENFDKEKDLWVEIDPDGLGGEDKWYFVEASLLEVLVLTQIDKKRAQEKYESMKKRPELYSEEHQEWNSFQVEDKDGILQQLPSPFFWPQLLNTLIHKALDYPDAENMYRERKRKSNHGLDRMGPNYKLVAKMRLILLESYFDPESAKKMLEQLKNAEYSDSQNEWGSQNDRRSNLQLYPLLIEAQIANHEAPVFQEREIPEERNF